MFVWCVVSIRAFNISFHATKPMDTKTDHPGIYLVTRQFISHGPFYFDAGYCHGRVWVRVRVRVSIEGRVRVVVRKIMK